MRGFWIVSSVLRVVSVGLSYNECLNYYYYYGNTARQVDGSRPDPLFQGLILRRRIPVSVGASARREATFFIVRPCIFVYFNYFYCALFFNANSFRTLISMLYSCNKRNDKSQFSMKYRVSIKKQNLIFKLIIHTHIIYFYHNIIICDFKKCAKKLLGTRYIVLSCSSSTIIIV